MNITTKNASPSPLEGRTTMAKSVSFNPLVRLRYTLHIDDYDTQEIDTAFYGADDYHRFEQDRKRTAQLIEDGYQFSSDSLESCKRGVEGMTQQALRIRFANRRKARAAVFEQQDRIWYEQKQSPRLQGTEHDGTTIATAYAEVVSPSVASAHAKGLADEKFVQSETIVWLLLLIEKKKESVGKMRMKCSTLLTRKALTATAA